MAADLSDPNQAAELFYRASAYGPIFALVNNAAIFEPVNFLTTTMEEWQRHININLTAPMLISQAMARETPEKEKARIVNILDWRALRPGVEHFPYTISKSALVAMTQSLAISLAPRIIVNGLALGAVLPPCRSTQATRLDKECSHKTMGNSRRGWRSVAIFTYRSRIYHR